MKRKRDKTFDKQAAYDALKVQSPEPPSQELKDRWCRHIDMKMTLDSRNDCRVRSYYPPTSLFYVLEKIRPTQIVTKEFYSNSTEGYQKYVVPTWNITDYDIVVLLFGDLALAQRTYSDSTGVVDFENDKGGRLEPQVNSKHPCQIVFDSYLDDLSISFYYRKLKAVCKGRKVSFHEVI